MIRIKCTNYEHSDRMRFDQLLLSMFENTKNVSLPNKKMFDNTMPVPCDIKLGFPKVNATSRIE